VVALDRAGNRSRPGIINLMSDDYLREVSVGDMPPQYVQNYADAKSEVVQEILARARA